MKKRWVYGSGLAVLAAGLALHVSDARFIRAISSQSFDALLSATAEEPKSDQVSIVDIDEQSLAALGQWPWSRHVLARLIDRLRDAGASVIAFDIVFAEPDRSSPDVLIPQWSAFSGQPLDLGSLPPDYRDFDHIFARSLSSTSSVLAVFLSLAEDARGGADADAEDPDYRGRYLERGGSGRMWIPQATSVLRPLGSLYQSATSVGFINTIPDPDGIMRRTPLVAACGAQRIYPALSLEALRIHRGATQYRIEYDDEGAAGVRSVGLQELNIPTDAHGRLGIRYRSSPFPRYSALDILEGRITKGELRGRIVFIGTSAAGLRDLVATPLQSEFPGVEVHATAIDNILAGDALVEPRWAVHVKMLTTLLAGIMLIILIDRSRAVWALIFTMLFVGAAIGSSAWLLQQAHLVLIPTEGAVTLLSIYSVVTVLKYRQEEHDRRKIRGMFGQMVSRDVLRYMEEHPASLSLAGRRAQCTTFFSDLAGFTSIAESMPPDRLSELLNAYMTPMTHIIMRHGGYVDKFNGDAIMAVWGVPYAQQDHAARAARAALEQLAELERLNPEFQRRFGLTLSVRIGLSSGEVTAGNMGSADRFQYTVLGDVVNLAARLESLNKVYGTSILASDAMRSQLHGDVVSRRIDVVAVAGKSIPVPVHEIRRESTRPGWISVYETAWDAYADRRWEEAERGFRRVFEDSPEDRPSILMLERIARFRRIPPPDDWSGSFIQQEK